MEILFKEDMDIKLFPEWKMIATRNYFYIREIYLLFNLPLIRDIINVINKKYLIYEMCNTHCKNICPCKKRPCIIIWTNHFKIGTDITKFQNIAHCPIDNCHTIIIDTTKSRQCISCSRYFCNRCHPYENRMGQMTFLIKDWECVSCNRSNGAACGVNCNQQ